jgi:phosphoglycolate phosphatase-like HAD superfamily hydrolase
MKKKMLIFRFENVLINVEPEKIYARKNLWKLIEQLKADDYYLGLISSLSFESFVKAGSKFDFVSRTISSFDRLIRKQQADNQLDEFLRFAEKRDIQKEEILYFGCHYGDLEAAKKSGIDFIGVISELPENNLLSGVLSPENKVHPVLLAEFLANYYVEQAEA